ncbi:hypothetical protein LCI01_06780 [Leuconostoc citreum]|jgi:hypothetical protein|nr:hypothetical protein LCTS_14160 [Leuconostoc citreum]GEK61042.1 hypothetical protein LCI01_06780 [Leuconostoc citreum]
MCLKIKKKLDLTVRPLDSYDIVMAIGIISTSCHFGIYNFIFLYLLFMLPEIIETVACINHYFSNRGPRGK